MFTVKQGSSDVPPATMASEAGPAVDRHPARQVGNPEPDGIQVKIHKRLLSVRR